MRDKCIAASCIGLNDQILLALYTVFTCMGVYTETNVYRKVDVSTSMGIGTLAI